MLVLISSMAQLGGVGVAVLDDAAHPAVLVAHDPAVAGGVVEPGGEQGAGRPGQAVLADERGDRLGPHQRRVAGQHHDVAVVGVEAQVVGQAGQAHRHRVAGAPLDALLDELERDGAAGPPGAS